MDIGSYRVFEDKLYVIDLTPEGFQSRFISGYIIPTEEGFISIEQGPASTWIRIRDLIDRHGLEAGEPRILVTHLHLDHSGGVGSLSREYPKSRIYVHPRGVRHIIDPSRLWYASREALGPIAEAYGEPTPVDSRSIVATMDGDAIDVAGEKFIILHTEGHASHHQSIYWVNADGMFVGDSAGIYIDKLNYIIPSTIYPFKYVKYMDSLRKMISFKPRLLFYPHYGIVEDGYRILMDHYRQVESWYRIAMDAGGDLEKYIEMLKSSDERFREVYGLTRKYDILGLLLRFSLQGLLAEAGREPT